MAAFLMDEKNEVVQELVNVESIVKNFNSYRKGRQIREFIRPIKIWTDRYYFAVKRRLGEKPPVISRRHSQVPPDHLFKRIYAVCLFIRALG
jgi:hypothetical protein